MDNNRKMVEFKPGQFKTVESDTSDKRYQWYFISQSGWVWVVWHILGIPVSEWDKSDIAQLPGIEVAPDGSGIWPQVHLFSTKEKALAFAYDEEYDHLYDKTDTVDLSDIPVQVATFQQVSGMMRETVKNEM